MSVRLLPCSVNYSSCFVGKCYSFGISERGRSVSLSYCVVGGSLSAMVLLCSLKNYPQNLEDLNFDVNELVCNNVFMNAVRRLLCSRCFIVLCFCSVCTFAVFRLFLWSAGGSDASSPSTHNYQFNVTYAKQILNGLCQLYRKNELSGDYCNRLCYHGNYSFVDFYMENKAVLVLLIGGQKIVLKSQHPYFSAFDQLPESLSERDFVDKVLEMANYHLELGWPNDRKNHLLEMIWPASSRSDQLSSADRRSIWSLVNQEEYLIFTLLNSARVFPKIMGSCGHFYAVEHLVPFRLKSYYTNLKAKILVHLMGTLKLFYEFLNEPLHWCDVKFENFGLSADYPKRFLVMDADMVFTESRMGSLLQNLGCRNDADCQFFDCRAKCDKTRNHCSARINDNVDVFCQKLVVQLFGSFWTKSNRYLAACHDPKLNASQRLQELRLVWAWSLSDV